MGLKITNQTNEQECGVCAITSLHNLYYSEKLEKEQVLDKSHINSSGMTIFDFETLAQTTGLDCESYEVEWSEFLSLKIKNYFVALVSTKNDQTNHYVIVKKYKKILKIFDSCSLEPKELNISQFKNIFLNVIILINKKPNKLFSKIFCNVKTVLLFDLKFVLLNVLLSLLILSTSILGASFLNWIIDSAILTSSINNLITISFVFIFVYFSNDLLTYISSLYVSNQMKTYYMLFTNKILSGIEYKKNDFLNKVDRNWIYKVDDCVHNISNFCVLEVNKLITNLIFSFICICVVGSTSLYMLIFILLFALIEFVPFLFSYRKKKELFISIVRTENKNSQHYKRLIQNLSFEVWQNKRKTILHCIKSNYSSIYKNFNDATLFRSNKNLIQLLITSLTEIFLVAVASYLIIKNKQLSIGKLTFIIATFSLYKNSIKDIFNYFLARIEFNTYWQVYKDLTNVSNLVNKHLIEEEIRSISFICNDTTYEIDSTKRTNIVNYSINNLIQESSTIKFNNKVIECNSKEFYDKIIVLDQNSEVCLELFVEQLNKNPQLVSNYLKNFDIDINKESICFYDQIIINLLCLLNEKDKIVIIDSILHYIKVDHKMVIKDLINKIRKNNYVFIVGDINNDQTKH